MTREKTSNSALVLLIETDALIHELVTRWLTEAGYRVAAQAGNGNPAPIDGEVALVIADVPNPAQAGAALQHLGERYGAPVLATSGRFRRGPAAAAGAARRLGVAKVLPKPFSGEEFLAAVQACLQEH